ncbi:ABC transporter transmembrane domain-containing protein [Alteromonas naphthalenivorans]|uniref:Lipid ABC transporter ATP-binding/permease MsbA n=1 Tax=Alteromonas naphthalenivorans TaxID=715451 RepID=F5ZFX7_ALTNA|nr:ABC transporter transmembrane domain-containing protein [Alteromonas naphthalenivorans]AEF05745.1 lipid ABC transporter ATP-binding/permease MsbA [Alteromonas naphthalenivorans]
MLKLLTSTSDGSLLRLLAYLVPHKQHLLIIASSLLVFSAVDAGMIYFIKPLIDDGLAKTDSNVLQVGAALIFAIFLLRGAASFLANYSMAYVSNSVTYKIRNQAFVHLMSLPLSYFSQHPKGKLISKITYDAEQLAKATSETLVILIRESLIVCILLAVMFYTSWQLSLIFLIIGPVIAWVIHQVSGRFKVVSKSVQTAMGEMTIRCEQAINNHQQVLCLGTLGIEAERFDNINNSNRRQMMKLASAEAFSNPVIQLIASLAIVFVLLSSSIPGVLNTLTPGTFTTILVAMGSLLRPLKQLSKVNLLLQRGIAAAESLFQLLDENPEVDSGAKVIKSLKQGISFEHLSFNYVNSKTPTLRNVSLSIRKNTFVAIVGQSGSGKSTLVSLLLRLHTENNPSILIDGQPINDFTLKSYRKMFALVSQNVQLIDGTIAENICYGCTEQVNKDDLFRAVKQASLWDFIQKQPNNIDTPVGENGCLLSGGQKQRVAIARAILSKAPILIFDEPTSALDAASEQRIFKTLNTLAEDKTIIMVTHNLGLVSQVDQIFVMSNGELIDSGTHEQLINRSRHYSLLYQQHNSGGGSRVRS